MAKLITYFQTLLLYRLGVSNGCPHIFSIIIATEIKDYLLKSMNLKSNDILAIQQLKGSTSSLIHNITRISFFNGF